VRGAGEQTASGSGDLHVHISVQAHPLFVREGADLLCEVPVSFPQAALGSTIDVPTLEGKVSMRLPAGTQPGKVFRLRGKGFPIFGGYGKGDQLVTVTVEVPQSLSPRQRALLEELAEAMDREPSMPKRQGFLDKLKQLFD
jgi:molecular chaperone DnaJ